MNIELASQKALTLLDWTSYCDAGQSTSHLHDILLYKVLIKGDNLNKILFMSRIIIYFLKRRFLSSYNLVV